MAQIPELARDFRFTEETHFYYSFSYLKFGWEDKENERSLCPIVRINLFHWTFLVFSQVFICGQGKS